MRIISLNGCVSTNEQVRTQTQCNAQMKGQYRLPSLCTIWSTE